MPAAAAGFPPRVRSELCAEARKGPLARSRGSDPEEVGGIDFLELHWSWRLVTSSSAYSGVHAGGRINWSVSLTPLRELLDLPVRFRDDFDVAEDDIDAKAYGHIIASGKCRDLLLGQLIQGILGKLPFHGGPETRAGFLDDLMARKAEVDAGTARLIPADELFAEYDLPGFDALFESIAGVSRGDLRRALRSIDDDQPVGPWLDRKFQGKVVVRVQFRDRPGRDFRKALRTAGR